MGILLLILVVLIVWILVSCIKIVPQAKAMVVERLGAYQATWGVGLHFKVPIIDRVARKVDLKEQVVDFAPQAVITKDNVTMQIDTVVFYQITDPKMFCYGVANPIMATDIQRNHQHCHARIPGRGNGPMGNQSQPCGTEKYHSAGSYPRCHGKTDEGRA